MSKINSLKDGQPRNLDVAPSASMDVVALNNKIVAMRPVVRKARVHVIHKMTRCITKLRKKRGTKEQVEKNTRKADRLVQEIQAIRGFHCDKASKFSLANTDSFTDICKQPSSSLESRALVRLSENNILSSVVKDFRKNHSDWKELASYLLTKNTGRRYKKKKKQPTKMKRKIANKNVDETIVNTFLTKKLEGDTAKMIHDIRDKSNMKQLSQERKERVQKSKQTTLMKSNATKQALEESNSNVAADDNDVSHSHSNSASDNDNVPDDHDSPDTDNDANLSHDNDGDESSVDNFSPNQKVLSNQKSTGLVDDVRTEIFADTNVNKKVNREMVVRKFIVKEFEAADDANSGGEDSRLETPKFLAKDGKKLTSCSKRDAFFVFDDEDSDDDDDDQNALQSENVEDSEQEAGGQRDLFAGRENCDSSFVSSLRDQTHAAGNSHMKSLFSKSLGEQKPQGRGFCGQPGSRTLYRGQGLRGRSSGSRTSSRGQGLRGRRSDSRPSSWRGAGGQRGFRGRPGGRLQRGGHNDWPLNDRNDSQERRLSNKPYDDRMHNQKSSVFDKRKFPTNVSGVQEEKSFRQVKPKNDTRGTMHPSWLASKKRKEQSQIQTFQGKKVKFDDD